MPLYDQVEIPPNILVRCPLVGFRQRRVAQHCERCEHFRGLFEQLGRHDLPFERAFAARCAHPIDRELYALDEG